MEKDFKGNSQTILTIIQEVCVISILTICIFVRVINYNNINCSWIWIVNYIGMAIAVLNLFISKTISLYEEDDSSYSPFLGLTIFTSILLVTLGFVVGCLQSWEYATTVNDVITLLSLVFSLSQGIWEALLDSLKPYIK